MINLISNYYRGLGYEVTELNKEYNQCDLLLKKEGKFLFVKISDSFTLPSEIYFSLKKEEEEKGYLILICVYKNGIIYHTLLYSIIVTNTTDNTVYFSKNCFIKSSSYNNNELQLDNNYSQIANIVLNYYKKQDPELKIAKSSSYLYKNTSFYLYKNSNKNTFVHVDISIQEPVKLYGIDVFKFSCTDFDFYKDKNDMNINICVYNNNSSNSLYLENVHELLKKNYMVSNNTIYFPVENFTIIRFTLLTYKEKLLHNNLKEISQILGVPVIELAKVLLTKCNTRTYTLHLLTNIISKER